MPGAPPPPPAAAGSIPRRRRWRRWLAGIAALALLTLGGLLVEIWTALGAAPAGQRLERVRGSKQHHQGRFRNPLPEQDSMLRATWRFLTTRGRNQTPQRPPPVERRTRADYDTPPASGLRITWLGHSTTLIELDGARLLTDPVWSERSSPSRFIGPRRFHEPPLPLDALPALHAILISHDHFDHLDHRTIRALAAHGAPFHVPLGIGAHLEAWGIPAAQIREHDWWDEAPVGPVTIALTPARHFSGRHLFDRNRTLWGSWTIIGPRHRVFFSGDTAMFPGFADIGARYGPFDVAMLESGAYDRAWADVHLGPEQAVQAAALLGARHLLPIHWGTFNLGLHGWTEPVERILLAAEAAGIPVVVPRPGGRFEPASPPAVSRWWPRLDFDTAAIHPVVSSGLGASPR